MVLFPPGKGGGEEVAYGGKGKGVLIHTLTEGKVMPRYENYENMGKPLVTTDLSRRVYCIRIEDLNVSGMIANHKLANAVSNNCFYEVRRQLVYKQAHYGSKVEIVSRWFPSSKMCSHCGHIQPMKLSDRVFCCQKCNHTLDRDENAARNLEKAPDKKVSVGSTLT
ncbi:MAG: zinc ribbon domain-containing protein [Cyanobacteria bacterium J06635_10]